MSYRFSEIAAAQLDALDAENPDAFEDVMDLIDAITDEPGGVRATADIIATAEGPRFKNFVTGRYPLAVFWSDHPADGPRIEAIFPHPAHR
ncbi:MAG: hypothetical protein Q4G43_04520 [Mobilicoccus sp.]|nr:hypothetical protein [Mobilicoccus sp.]